MRPGRLDRGKIGTQLVGLFDHPRPILDGTGEVAAEDVVERGRVGPVGFQVVDFESHIRRDKAGLDRAEIIAQDLKYVRRF